MRPVLIFTDDAEDALFPAVVIVVDAGKVIVVPLEIGDIFMVLTNGCSQVILLKEDDVYLIYAPWKVKGSPSL